MHSKLVHRLQNSTATIVFSNDFRIEDPVLGAIGDPKESSWN